MISAVFFTGGAHAGAVDLETGFQHVLDAIEGAGVIGRGRGVGAFLDDVADGDDFGRGFFHIASRVYIADAAHTDDRHIQLHDFLLVDRAAIEPCSQSEFKLPEIPGYAAAGTL